MGANRTPLTEPNSLLDISTLLLYHCNWGKPPPQTQPRYLKMLKYRITIETPDGTPKYATGPDASVLEFDTAALAHEWCDENAEYSYQLEACFLLSPVNLQGLVREWTAETEVQLLDLSRILQNVLQRQVDRGIFNKVHESRIHQLTFVTQKVIEETQ